MKKMAKKLGSIRPSAIRKLFEISAGMKGVISLGIGEPDFDTPEHIKEAAKKALDEGYTHYTPTSGILGLREAISEKYESEYSLEYDPGEILITCGGVEAVFDTFQAFVDPGDEVLIPDPSFMVYEASILLAGGKPVYFQADETYDFKPNYEDLNEKITPKTKMIVINSPSNPTGAVCDESELKPLAEIAVDNDLVVLSDEVYEKIIYDGLKHVCFASFEGCQERTVIINSFSKVFAMTGWRVGFALAKGDLFPPIFQVHQFNTTNVNAASQVAAMEGLKNPKSKEFTENMVKTFDKRRKAIVDGLNKIDGISCKTPGGAFYVFPNIEGTGMNSVEFSERVLMESKVAVVPGSEFGREGGEGHIRASYGTSLENIKEAIQRIEQALEKR